MKQMVAPDGVKVYSIEYLSTIESGFFRVLNGDGKVFFANKRADCPVPWPVISDGSILTCTDYAPDPLTRVEILDPKSIGITKIQWAKP